MENASKALLIAGAVLIVLVLISVGVLLLNRTGDTSNAAADTSNVMVQQSQAGANKIKESATFFNTTTEVEP